MNPGATKPRRWHPTLIALLVAALLYGAYELTMSAVRRHVGARIARNDGHPLPDFVLRRVDGGGSLARSDLAGKRIVLHFFRSRCEMCTGEAPAIRAFAEEIASRGDVALVSVMTDAVLELPPSETAATLAHHAFRHPVLMADAALLDAFHGQGWAQVTPITYVTDRRGVIVRSLRGAQTVATLRASLAMD
jgi:peroxiredoxin